MSVRDPRGETKQTGQAALSLAPQDSSTDARPLVFHLDDPQCLVNE